MMDYIKQVFIVLVALIITIGSGCTAQPESGREMTKERATITTDKTAITAETPATTAQAPLILEITSVTSPVSPGSSATLTATTTPGALCDITVFYASGPSEAAGLEPKTAGPNGIVSWTWKVGTNTTPGTWPIIVTASLSGKTVTRCTTFVVK